jgi:hypothetical protein
VPFAVWLPGQLEAKITEARPCEDSRKYSGVLLVGYCEELRLRKHRIRQAVLGGKGREHT